MSRCFPFPPPGYVLNGTSDKALIEEESIKCAEVKAKKEQRRKERRRREKKEKKRKERGVDGESENRKHKRRHKEEGRKRKESENDGCLEKSSITLEYELLQSTSQNSCDSTVNSNDIPKQLLPDLDDGRYNNDSESIIRIRLPIRRQKDPEVKTDKDQQKPCPSRATKLDSSATREQPDSSHYPCSTSTPQHASKPHESRRKDPIFATKLGKEKKISSSTTPETSQQSSLCSICPPSIAEQFLNVVENWVPNTVERGLELTNSEDEECCWWVAKKPSSCKQLNRNNETAQVTSITMAWPRARLLPEADVYALPYTIPF